MTQKFWNTCKMIGYVLMLVYGSVLYYRFWGLVSVVFDLSTSIVVGAFMVFYFGLALPGMMIFIRYLDIHISDWMNHHIHGYHDYNAYL